MKISKKNLIILSLAVVLSVSAVVMVVKAATDLTVPGGALDGGVPVATMHTIEDIYHKLTNTALDSAHTLAPSAGPAGTMHTLEDVYTASNDANLVEGNIKNGVAIMGKTGTYTGALTWHDSPYLVLCWDANQSPTCTIANGGLVSATGDTNNPLGAVEYCKYLNLAGVMQSTIQNIWRLPTESELLASLSDQFVISPAVQTGFVDDTYYWSGSPYGSTNAWVAGYYNGYVSGYNGAKANTYSVRCVH